MLSSGASRLLRLIRWFHSKCGACFPKQKFLAARLGCVTRTIQRYLAELVAAGLVSITRRGRTANEYTLLSVRAPAQNVASNVASKRLPSIYTESIEETTSASSTPVVAGVRLPFAGVFEMPEPTIRHAAGRVERNPAWSAVQDVLRGALERIQRARNPVAYERAVLQREFPQFWRVAWRNIPGR